MCQKLSHLVMQRAHYRKKLVRGVYSCPFTIDIFGLLSLSKLLNPEYYRVLVCLKSYKYKCSYHLEKFGKAF